MKIKCIKHARKGVDAISTKHQVHLGIDHAYSALISVLIDIISAIVKNDIEILEYKKCNQYPKCSVSLPNGTVGWSAVCDCDFSWS